MSTRPADTLTTTYTVGGVRIIHRRTNLSTVVMNVYLLGGVRSAPAGKDGIENFLLQVSERGTEKYPRDMLRRAVARTGAEMVVEPHEDWTMIGVRTTPDALDSSWSILADRVAHPRLDSVDVEFVREQMLAGVRQRQDSPDALLDYLADSVTYAGSPYAASPVGTESSLAGITRADLVRFHREQFTKSRMLLVVVGNVTRASVERLVGRTIATLPSGAYQWTLPDTAGSATSDAVLIRRTLPTNYLQGYFSGPPANSPDAPALRVAAAVLSGRLFAEVRSKRNLTYAVSANYRDRGLTSVGLYVTTTLPDSVLTLMTREIRALQTFEIETDLLAPIIRQFITEYFLDNETSTAQADFLARAMLYHGNAFAGDHFVADLRAVTGADVRRVAQLYFTGAHWAYIGDPTRVTPERLTRF
ncbi:MAG TPA: pitrilysin family protein [Gemmatimonadaceae bacterium]|nr:pitrilysin family protein [Gemmatimonadaceae bacterium]